MKRIFAPAALAAILAGCGGSGSSGGIDGTGIHVTSAGTITEFGSAVVNDIRYATGATRLIADDDGSVVLENPSDAALQQVLGLGQLVTVRGTHSGDGNGVASTIRFDDELVGAVTSVSADDGSFVVLGQTVAVTPDTFIDDSIIEDFRGGDVADDQRLGDLPETLDQLLTPGQLVAVSGFPSRNGIEATRVENVTDPGGSMDAEIKGFVTNLGGGQFQINALTITYDASDLDDSFGGRGLADGDFVEVHGTPTGNLLDANRIELEDDFLDDDFDAGEIEIEGLVQRVLPDDQGRGGIVVINGFEIRVNDVSPFRAGLHVEIHGTLQSDGSVVITRIDDEAEDTVRIEDRAVSVDADSVVTRLGLDIAPTDRTRLEDDTIEDDDEISLGGFLANVAGQRIEARGFPLAGGVAWTRAAIEDDDEMDCRLRGPAANITGDADNFNFEIEGVTIDVSNVSDNNFEGVDGQPIGRQAFFAQLQPGDVIQASSDSAGVGCITGMLTAREVEQEPAHEAIFDDGGDDGGPIDDEIVGTVSNVGATSFNVAGVTVTVNDETIIDDSLIEAARGTEVDDEAALGTLAETLQQLLPNGQAVSVSVDRSSGIVAVRIEDL